MDLNRVVLSGRLAAPVEVRQFESGSRLARYLVTVRSEQPKRRVDVIPVARWDPPLDDRTPDVGEQVWVAGSVQRRFWEVPEGRRSRLEVVAHEVRFVSESAGATADKEAVMT